MLYSYIELADVNSSLGVVEQMTTIMGKELPSRARMKVRKGYVIMSSVEGSIDKIALIDSDEDNLVASTGFFVLKEKSLNKETILILLKALSKQYLVREAQGSILTAIPYDSLERVILPYVSHEVETKIASLVQQSHEARKKSKKLLEIAKRAVEIAIEKNEEEALSYIAENSNS
jgi:type I restriction enzyme S subunit/type I restriction enzyme M protein